MDIGEKIRNLRIKNDLTQEELAERSELTKGFISQLERNKTSPSIASLVDILEALGTNLQDFFSDDIEEKIVFKADDAYIYEDEENKSSINWIVPNAQKNQMEPIIVEISPGGQTREEGPQEAELFGYVLEGRIILGFGNDREEIKKGECFYFKPDKSYQIYNESKKTSKLLWVSTPPSF